MVPIGATHAAQTSSTGRTCLSRFGPPRRQERQAAIPAPPVQQRRRADYLVHQHQEVGTGQECVGAVRAVGRCRRRRSHKLDEAPRQPVTHPRRGRPPGVRLEVARPLLLLRAGQELHGSGRDGCRHSDMGVRVRRSRQLDLSRPSLRHQPGMPEPLQAR